MFTGALALVIRYVLIIGGGALAMAGVITSTADPGIFCFDSKHVADMAANAVALMLGGGVSAGVGIGWRFLVKKKGGVT